MFTHYKYNNHTLLFNLLSNDQCSFLNQAQQIFGNIKFRDGKIFYGFIMNLRSLVTSYFFKIVFLFNNVKKVPNPSVVT